MTTKRAETIPAHIITVSPLHVDKSSLGIAVCQLTTTCYVVPMVGVTLMLIFFLSSISVNDKIIRNSHKTGLGARAETLP